MLQVLLQKHLLKLAGWNNSSLPPKDDELKRPQDYVLKLNRNKLKQLQQLKLRRKRKLTLQLLRIKGGNKLMMQKLKL